jgi:hypothetical protein
MFKIVLAVLVYPPDHPGDVSAGGQGGDHSLAMDGSIMQVSLLDKTCFMYQKMITSFFCSHRLAGIGLRR